MDENKKIENFEKFAVSVEKHGLGIVSFIILIFLMGNQLYTSQQFTEKFFELESIKIKELSVTNERLTKLERLMEKVFEKK